MQCLLLHRFGRHSNEVKDQVLLERRLFENIWMIYASGLLTFFLSDAKELEIPLNISDRNQRNAFFTYNLPKWEINFTLYWSNHFVRMACGNQCSRALVIDGFQKPDRFVCQYKQYLIHSSELGNL